MPIEEVLKQISDILQKFEAVSNNEEIVGVLVTLNETSYNYNGERFIVIEEQL